MLPLPVALQLATLSWGSLFAGRSGSIGKTSATNAGSGGSSKTSAAHVGSGSSSTDMPRIWGVTTTIFEPTPAVHTFVKNVPHARLVVVGDLKTPNASWRAYEGNFSSVVYLSADDQVALPFRSVGVLPWNHFGRKNVGFLYAIQSKAHWIFDFECVPRDAILRRRPASHCRPSRRQFGCPRRRLPRRRYAVAVAHATPLLALRTHRHLVCSYQGPWVESRRVRAATTTSCARAKWTAAGYCVQ